MKKTLLLIALLMSAIVYYGQTTLYSENFNGNSHTFTLNTTDVSSTNTGYNQWVVNDIYNGGTFNVPCFNTSTTIVNTPSQPGAITGSPNSKYLHIVNLAAQSAGINNANFLASDGGIICNNNETYFAKMSNDISTIGYTNVTFSCYYLCSGSSSTFGELYYSTDGGSTWQLQLGNMYNTSSWQSLSQTNSMWDNQATLRFGFRFVNNASFSASDPPLSVDEIIITGTPVITNSITINSISSDTLCPKDTVIVNYTASGTFNSGNIFTAELSDASGGFSAPVAIGSVNSTTSGTIIATIPTGTSAGSGYRIRVKSSDPAVIGNDNGYNLVIGSFPVVNFNSNVSGLNVQFIDNSTGGSAWLWDFGDGNTSTLQNPTHTYASADTFIVCLTVTGTAGCKETICRDVIVNSPAGLNEGPSSTILIYPNPAESLVILDSELLRSGGTLYVYSSDGRLVKTTMIGAGNNIYTMGIEDLSAGIYVFHLKTNDTLIHHTFIKK